MQFKDEKDRVLFTYLNPILIMIYADLFNYTKDKYGIDLVVTATASTLEFDKSINRKSPSHREFRAIDIRTSNLTKEIISDLVSYVNNKWVYKGYRYLSNSGKERLAYYHNGTAPHVHLAIHSKYKYSEEKLELLNKTLLAQH